MVLSGSLIRYDSDQAGDPGPDIERIGSAKAIHNEGIVGDLWMGDVQDWNQSCNIDRA